MKLTFFKYTIIHNHILYCHWLQAFYEEQGRKDFGFDREWQNV